MPTYDYRCTACKHEFELFQSMKDAPKRKCPACGKNALERLIGTGAAVLFKGSGFYQTDYRSKSYTEAAKKDSESASGKSESKSDSKSESSSAAETKPKGDSPPKPTKTAPKERASKKAAG